MIENPVCLFLMLIVLSTLRQMNVQIMLNFLDSMPEEYDVFLSSDVIVGAFGLIGNDSEYKSINWILISPDSQGLGIGSIFMNRAISLANNAEIKHIKIAASHLSAPFFSKYGAVKVLEIKNGWGPDMHRIDMELMVSA